MPSPLKQGIEELGLLNVDAQREVSTFSRTSPELTHKANAAAGHSPGDKSAKTKKRQMN
jgi:hypothetical protein